MIARRLKGSVERFIERGSRCQRLRGWAADGGV